MHHHIPSRSTSTPVSSTHYSPSNHVVVDLKNAEDHERHRPRPLPRPPVTEEQHLTRSNSRSLPPRPLPAPPPPTKSPPPSLSINTLPFKLSTLNLTQKLSPASSSHLRHRHPSVLLTLDTSSEVLNRPSCSKDTMAGSPISPPILAPTPRTARQKRISKLQRHLGEIIPQDLVPLAPIPARLRSVYEWEHPQPLDALQRPEDTFRSPTPAALIAVRLKAFEEERRDSSEAHPDLEEEEELWDPRLVYYADKNGAGSAHDRQWLWEKEGRRWEADDPAHVVHALRTL